MAKRKRLIPAAPGSLDRTEAPPVARAPIAQVAGDAAAAAAFHDVAGELARAREEGRLVLRLPLSAVQAGHLTRDRMGHDPDEMAALKDSLRARGQQTPIEVVALGEGRYGLVSGWRRLTALAGLQAETGEAQFGTVLALVRQPEDDAAAYVAMVEENEIRADLSFFERARIVARAVQAGVFPDETAALQGLFAAASYSKRSKIKSFLRVVAALEGVLRHPTRLSEHLGLKLAKALEADPALPARIKAALVPLDPEDAGAEMAALQAVLSPAKAPPAAPEPEIVPGLTLVTRRGAVELKGPGLTEDLLQDLTAWLKARG